MAYARTYMDDLTLQERLFSIEEPYSLFNQVVRAVPSDAKAPQMVAGVFRQVGSLPATLLATLTGSAKAATPTPQQIADVTGVRQYGYGPEDLARATSPEIFAEAQPACDQDYDNEEEVNLCMADRETAKALLCSVADCQEFNNGFLEDGTSTTAGLWSNVKQQWTVKQMTAALGLW